VIFTAGGVKLSRSLRGGRVQRAEIPVSLFAEAIDGDPKKAPPAAVRWLATTQGRRLNYRRTCPLVRRNERRGSAALIGRLERCIFRSRRRTTWCEFSARLFLRANPVHGGLSSQVVGGRRRSRSSWPSAGSRSPAPQSQLPSRRGATERFERLDDAQPTQVLGERRSELDVRRQLIRHEHVWGVQDFGLITPQGESRQTAAHVRTSPQGALRSNAQ